MSESRSILVVKFVKNTPETLILAEFQAFSVQKRVHSTYGMFHVTIVIILSQTSQWLYSLLLGHARNNVHFGDFVLATLYDLYFYPFE